ncbi:MAG: helicase HerA-like domain-containing protein, partial [Rhodoglobus sp.]|nr:helicase HerA-like domain-containing protein [Rhodoglobus sp.]
MTDAAAQVEAAKKALAEAEAALAAERAAAAAKPPEVTPSPEALEGAAPPVLVEPVEISSAPLTPAEVDVIRAGYIFDAPALEMGALVNGEALPDVPVRIPIAMLNRHGLVAGATGTGKTKTLQVLAEQLSAAGVPVFTADIKGDLSGIASPGEASEKLLERSRSIGQDWSPAASPTEYFTLGDLEGHLMALQAGEGDSNTLNAVFRAIHSIKGGAGAFGFDRLVNFAHIFETVLDLMRDGRLEPNPDSVLLVLRCADILSDLVRAAQTGGDLPPEHENDGRRSLIALAATVGVNADPHAADEELAALDAALGLNNIAAEPEPEPEPTKVPQLKYLVKFAPRDALYQRANEPLILIRELRNLGG